MGHFRWRAAVWVLAAAFLTPGAPRAQDDPGEEVQWVERPTPADLERAAPPEARRNGIEGKATLTCLVTRSGRLQSCTIKSETPAGMGFGDAALRVAPLYRLAARSSEVDLEGSQISFGLRFRFSAASAAPTPAAPTAAARPAAPPAAVVAGGLPAEIARLTPPGRVMRIGVVPGWQVDFMDLDRVTRAGDLVDVIRLTVYSDQPSAGERAGQYDVWGLRFDCRTNDYTVLGARTYNAQGTAVSWERGSADIQASPPDSVYAAMADIACQKGTPARLDAGSIAEALDASRRLLTGP